MSWRGSWKAGVDLITANAVTPQPAPTGNGCTTARAAMAVLMLAVAALAGCSPQPPYRERLYAFGTVVEVTLYGLDEARARAATEALHEKLRTWHRQWHPWQGDGLARINRALAAGRTTEVPPALSELIRRARRLEQASGERFSPGIGALVRLWGFDRGTALPKRPPPDTAIDAVLADSPRLADLELGDGTLRSDGTAVQIDLGAFAKGVAVNRALTLLREHGARAALVSMGGDIGAFGRPAERPWRIGIRAPRGEGLLAAATLEAGEVIFTSGDYERYFEHDGIRYHHLLDPASGRPARDTRSVTVIADDAALADAAATALFVAGPGEWQTVARDLGVRRVLLVDDNGGVHTTRAMLERIGFEQTPPPPLVEEATW